MLMIIIFGDIQDVITLKQLFKISTKVFFLFRLSGSDSSARGISENKKLDEIKSFGFPKKFPSWKADIKQGC